MSTLNSHIFLHGCNKTLTPSPPPACHINEGQYRAFMEFMPDPVFVFDLDNTVTYLNPAFEQVFGWTLTELQGRKLPFVPEHLKNEAREGLRRLYQDQSIRNFYTQRLTREGRTLDILLNAQVFLNERGEIAGQVVTMRDITQERREKHINQAFFKIAKALHQFRRLDDLLEYVTKEVQLMVDVAGALVLLVDAPRNEFYVRMASYDDLDAGRKMKEFRFPVDQGVAGQVYGTGQPLVVPDTKDCPYFFKTVDEFTGYRTRSLVDVPLWVQSRMIGVLCAVNKRNGTFEAGDVDLLSSIAGIVALPIENTRINEELNQSYEEVQSLNRAKDRVIHHLSHELKTPVAVLSASLELLAKKLRRQSVEGWERILARARRNLDRLLDMQYEIEDILRKRDYKTWHLLSALLEVCTDELEALLEQELESRGNLDNIRRRINEYFGPLEATPQTIDLPRFVADTVEKLRPRFAHRRCRLVTYLDSTDLISIPPEILTKIIEGLVRNAVENTPDDGVIHVKVYSMGFAPVLEVRDFGIGIIPEHQRLIFESYFSTTDTLQYATRNPFDFNAGGKGFDLLRMKIFSERYHFGISLFSRRCRYLPEATDQCSGDVLACPQCKTVEDCLHSGGMTTVTLRFTSCGRPGTSYTASRVCSPHKE